ncbi:TerC family protein [Alicyclobacillus suci]|uniref:TerC family protein n=1 Tax=Alicyclobacillus suci TaxID=2816080 RepID=UPI001A8F99D8|nr:hypothetical protein [Alicyclobacillus suci]
MDNLATIAVESARDFAQTAERPMTPVLASASGRSLFACKRGGAHLVHSIIQVFILNFVTALDNAIVLAGIFKNHKTRYWTLTICSAILLTITRALLVLAIRPISHLSGIQLVLGSILFLLALRTAKVNKQRHHGTKNFASGKFDTNLLKLLCLIVLTDFAASFDNLISIFAVTNNVFCVAIGVFFSIVPLLLLLPTITKVFSEMPWVQIIAAGVMVQTAIQVLLKDPLIQPHFPLSSSYLTHASFAAAILFVGISLGIYIRNTKRSGLKTK